MTTTPLDEPSFSAQTHSTELIGDPFSPLRAISQRRRLLVEDLGRLANPLSPSRAVDALAAAFVASAAARSSGWSRALLAIGSQLDLSASAFAFEVFSASLHPAGEVIEELWEGLVRPSFKPMYGRVTQADRMMVSMITSGRIRSRDIQPQYEDED